MTRSPRMSRAAAWLLVSLCLAMACGGDDPEPVVNEPAPELEAPQEGSALARVRASAEAIDDARLRAADRDPANWISHGHGYSEQRFSPLSQIHARNAHELRLAWRFPTGLRRGHEATPLVVDGVMYVTGSWSIVFALDASTGKQLWRWDPGVSEEVGRKACCDVVNRGVAIYKGRVYVGVLDGRLAALDAATGELIWETVTVDQDLPYTITGAPRVVDGKVIIGNGGAEFGVRGYVSAYDAESGELVWRTYTVPGDPSEGFESEALADAARTWNGKWWEIGGGGTVWDSMAFDPKLKLLYIGVGNGSPWSRYDRSPGGGDNLYLSSIIALDPDTGELQWHYQTTPGDNFDFTATQHMILADLTIDGKPRQVIMQAPKNGFFYVLDRATGELLSAENYVEVTWADGVDPETGRPIENESANYEHGLKLVKPTPYGGHNWQPMAFNPITGLVYIPAQEIQGSYKRDPAYEVREGDFNTATDLSGFATMSRDMANGHLLAWDPVNQREAWRHPHGLAWNGGVLTTAGNLVFQGTADGRFLALRADDGKLLWQSHHANTGIVAAPITYRVGGVQYVSVVAGWGGTFAISGGDASEAAHVGSEGVVLSYAIINEPLTPEVMQAVLDSQNPETRRGNELYHQFCVRCHGATVMAGGVNPDLRESVERLGDAFVPIVAEGLGGTSMPGFKDWISEDGIREIRAYVEYMATQ
jgi:quinohemoprotein ethanol dehydrogenase